MLGRLVLIALQIAVAWLVAPQVLRYISIGGDVQVLIHGAVFAVIVWVIGLIGSQVLKDVALPSPATLTFALVGGLAGAAMIVGKVPAMIPLKFPPLFLPLGLAILGYHLKR
jgi:hypothetical protein